MMSIGVSATLMVGRCVYIQSVDNLKYYVQLDDALGVKRWPVAWGGGGAII